MFFKKKLHSLSLSHPLPLQQAQKPARSRPSAAVSSALYGGRKSLQERNLDDSGAMLQASVDGTGVRG
ncbi:hypothetical protein ES332_A09G044100v1 [Gossypium tomentosum]|uniref:Uncharacterized protein n=1 Tax=Gossypium tomentosum TaxID=34277 RepID=A0A5D2P028_GOSTO|nr:hypothetical protein ES332_A09G044100v1 [Gossypium tomentosum]